VNRFSAREFFREFRAAEHGQALPLVACGVAVLLMMAGLGIDVGYLDYQKQLMQHAADAGASGSALAIISGSNYLNAGRNDAAANGYTNGSDNVSVTVNYPPQTTGDPYYNNTSYVEVIVAQPRPTFFMRVAGYNSVNVRARAVASAARNATGCIYALDPTDASSFLVDGNVTINSTCGIYVNSDSVTGIRKNGGSGSVTSTAIAVVGDYSGTGFSPIPTPGIAPFSDPLAGVSAPTVASGCATPVGNVYSPGTYCNGITIHGNGSYTFLPGQYTIKGGWTVMGGPTLTGTGVTFYFTKDASGNYSGVNIDGNATQSFSAPTDTSAGGIPGILFFQDRSLPVGSAASTFGGTSGQGYLGALYFPTTTLNYKGTPNLQTTATIMVAWELDFRGDTLFKNYTLLPGGGGPVKTSVLVE
jgi:Flp pilus assembly protein TadG